MMCEPHEHVALADEKINEQALCLQAFKNWCFNVTCCCEVHYFLKFHSLKLFLQLRWLADIFISSQSSAECIYLRKLRRCIFHFQTFFFVYVYLINVHWNSVISAVIFLLLNCCISYARIKINSVAKLALYCTSTCSLNISIGNKIMLISRRLAQKCTIPCNATVSQLANVYI